MRRKGLFGFPAPAGLSGEAAGLFYKAPAVKQAAVRGEQAREHSAQRAVDKMHACLLYTSCR